MKDLEQDFTMIFHVKQDSFTRIYNVNTTLQYYYRNLPNSKIIIIEEGKEHSKYLDFAQNYIESNKIGQFIFFKNDSEFYERPRLLNIASTKADTSVIATCDVDVIIDCKNVLKGIKLLKENNLGQFIAHNGSLIDCSINLRDEFILSDMDYNIFSKYIPSKLELLYRDENIQVRCCPNTDYKNVSTFLIFDHEKYNQFKGYCNHFKSWGWEDLCLQERLKKLDIGIGMFSSKNANCYHFIHPAIRQHGNSHFKINDELLNKVKRMNKQDILEFIKTWDFK